jgi:xanthine dehydrogenase YagT iron-sulfur-binding subunit
MTGKITLKINGLDYNVEAEPNETLLTVLREKLDITSPKRGCEMGNAEPVLLY